MKIAVTGARGLIGTEIIRQLAAEKFNSLGLSRAEADLTNPGSLAAACGPDISAVVHCAAVIPGKNPGEPEETTAQTNRLLDEQVIDYCQTHNRPLIYLSSTSVYGFQLKTPTNEDGPLNPHGPYAATKAASEKLIAQRVKSSIILRVGAPYGPRMTAQTVLKIFMDNALADRDLTWHGSGSREQVFIHVVDVARAALAALKTLIPEIFNKKQPRIKQHRVFNIAGAEVVSMKNLAEMIIRLTASGGQAHPSGQPDPQEGYRPRFSLHAAAEALGWQPLISLEDGLRAWLAGERPPC